MTVYLTSDAELTSVADAIRTKRGTAADLVYPTGFITAINAIPTGEGGGSINLQAKTVTPTTSSQTVSADGAYDGLSTVTVEAIPTEYIIPTGSLTVTTNGTHDVTNYATVSANISSWKLIATAAVTTATTSTSSTSLTTVTVGSSIFTKDKVIWVKIRDNAGKRAGYFVGSDNLFINYYDANNATTTLTYAGRFIHRYTTSNVWNTYIGSTTTGYGIYAYSITSAGVVAIYRRYNSTYSLTIDGTYAIEIYALDYPTNAFNIFSM